MSNLTGLNPHDVRSRNRSIILELIAVQKQVSRAVISQKTGLTKTTVGNVVSDLIQEKIIHETEVDMNENSMGRKPINLEINPLSPCICGMLIKRGLISVVFADYGGAILKQRDYAFAHDMNAERLVETLLHLFHELKKSWTRDVVAIGIAAVGPIDLIKNELANPSNFYGISNLPLPEIITRSTGLPAYLIHDANAGALAEKVYGAGRECQNFIYIQIFEGIGAGYVLNNHIYNGVSGKSGEIGHTSINFSGPVCFCGNVGCLEVYANIKNINAKIRKMRTVYPTHSSLPHQVDSYKWLQVLEAAQSSDLYAISALDEFCEYLSYALANTITLFDIQHIIIGYDAPSNETIITNILANKLNSYVQIASNRKVTVEKSVFGGNAPLIGTVALITNKFFNGELKF